MMTWNLLFNTVPWKKMLYKTLENSVDLFNIWFCLSNMNGQILFHFWTGAWCVLVAAEVYNSSLHQRLHSQENTFNVEQIIYLIIHIIHTKLCRVQQINICHIFWKISTESGPTESRLNKSLRCLWLDELDMQPMLGFPCCNLDQTLFTFPKSETTMAIII